MGKGKRPMGDTNYFKYYDIVAEEMTTGRKLGPMTTPECAEALGMYISYVARCCERGFYKNYKLTAKINESYRGKESHNKQEANEQTKKEQIKKDTPMKKTTTTESTTNALKLCFEGLRIIENQYAQYGFTDIATFIKWMYDNRWVENAI